MYTIFSATDANDCAAQFNSFVASIDGTKATVQGWRLIQFGETGGQQNWSMEVLAGGDGNEQTDRRAVNNWMADMGWGQAYLLQVMISEYNNASGGGWMSLKEAQAAYGTVKNG